ncbi:hypothetical protein MNV49_001314 [Pseudohyphozyma bogoriensis]|nr:hypothetical protein MNV49_001314 [Pseudohyphozyma bogoriensis]
MPSPALSTGKPTYADSPSSSLPTPPPLSSDAQQQQQHLALPLPVPPPLSHSDSISSTIAQPPTPGSQPIAPPTNGIKRPLEDSPAPSPAPFVPAVPAEPSPPVPSAAPTSQPQEDAERESKRQKIEEQGAFPTQGSIPPPTPENGTPVVVDGGNLVLNLPPAPPATAPAQQAYSPAPPAPTKPEPMELSIPPLPPTTLSSTEPTPSPLPTPSPAPVLATPTPAYTPAPAAAPPTPAHPAPGELSLPTLATVDATPSPLPLPVPTTTTAQYSVSPAPPAQPAPLAHSQSPAPAPVAYSQSPAPPQVPEQPQQPAYGYPAAPAPAAPAAYSQSPVPVAAHEYSASLAASTPAPVAYAQPTSSPAPRVAAAPTPVAGYDLTRSEAVLIRDEYDKINEWISGEKFKGIAIKKKKGGLVVWGQPGIGKSMFLREALAHAMSEGTPVLFIADDYVWYFFGPNGVALYETNKRLNLTRDAWTEDLAEQHPALLTLVDSHLSLPKLPVFLTTLPIRIVQAAFPLKSRYEWRGDRQAHIWLASLWSESEMKLVSEEIEPAAPLTSKALAQIFGPIPRFVFPEEMREAVVDTAEDRTLLVKAILKTGTVIDILNGSSLGNDEAANHRKVFKIGPRKGVENPISFPTVPQTKIIISAVSAKMSTAIKEASKGLKIAERSSLISVFSGSPVAGYVFEGSATSILAMVDSAKFAGRLSSDPPVDITVYAPPARFATLDAFLSTGAEIRLFQMTISSIHSMSAKGLRGLFGALKPELCTLPRQFFFVVPSKEVGEKLLASTKRSDEKMDVARQWKLTLGYVVLKVDDAESQQQLTKCGKDLLKQLTSEVVG